MRVLAAFFLLCFWAPPPFAAQVSNQVTDRVTAPLFEIPHADSTAIEPLLVGVIIGRQEVGALEVLREGDRFLIPLEAFSEIAGITITLVGELTRLSTPLGAVDLGPADLRIIHGETFLTQSAIEQRLGTYISFDREEYALRFDMPWRPAQGERLVLTDMITPEATPPAMSISTIREDLALSRRGDSHSSRSATMLAGRLAGGTWRVRYQDDFSGSRNLRQYAWRITRGRGLFLLGQQDLHLHPLLGSFELTGLQAAWTNQPLELFPPIAESRELLPRRVRPIATFRGQGPPGGMAELRIEGKVVDVQTIPLNGAYEFLEVQLPGRLLGQIEVLVYDRRNLSIPVAIHQQRPSVSEFLLSKGALIQLGGFGYDGNLGQDLMDEERTGEVAGFYQARYGIWDGVTVEAAIQESNDMPQYMGGLVVGLGTGSVLSLGAAGSRGKEARGADLEVHRGHWHVLGSASTHASGFSAPESEEHSQYFAELTYVPGTRMNLSLIGRRRLGGIEKISYVLPAISCWPTSRLSVRVRPDYAGDYQFDLYYRPHRRIRITVHQQDVTALDISQTLRRSYRVSLGTEFKEGMSTRYSGLLSYAGRGVDSFCWSLGASTDGKKHEALGSAEVRIGLGFLARVGVEQDLSSHAEGWRSWDSRVVTFGLTMDMAVVGGRLLPARAHAIRAERGGIAGQIKVIEDEAPTRHGFKNLYIFLNGQPAARTHAGGAFFVGDLEAGVYLVELDTENLPLELSPVRGSIVAEVAAGAVTGVSFLVRPEYGLAGRVADLNSTTVPGVRVELLDKTGHVLRTVITDRFGLFRIDGILVGVYQLRVSPESFPDVSFILPTRTVVIRDDFLFDQNLKLPLVLETESPQSD